MRRLADGDGDGDGDDTLFLRQDWTSYDNFMAEYARQGDGTPREVEALVCANIGLVEPWIEEIVDRLDVVAIAEIEGQLLFKLIYDEKLTEEQLEAFLVEAERLLEEWQAQAQ